jgi:hypothetical protein
MSDRRSWIDQCVRARARLWFFTALSPRRAAVHLCSVVRAVGGHYTCWPCWVHVHVRCFCLEQCTLRWHCAGAP